MTRLFKPLAAVAAAWALVACGGGGAPEAPALGSQQSALAAGGARSMASAYRTPAPAGSSIQRIDARLRMAKGPVDVWVTLEQNSLAAQRVLLAEQAGLAPSETRSALRGNGALRQGVAEHRQRVLQAQASLSSQLAGMGGRELARVHKAHNAIAVRIDASQLKQLAALPGVAKVRPVLDYKLDLSETVPYVGGAAVQTAGYDGTGITVAVLDSGIDYTHRNLGGAGTTAAYAAAAGVDAADPKSSTRDGLFPTAKVVDGFDFVGESWPNAERSEDDDPIDRQGHGTHVADIIGGRSLDGTHKGMAPGAKLVAVKVCSAVATSCNGIALLKAMDFAIDPNGDGDTADAVDVINMSLGSDYGQIEDDLTLAATNAVKLGVVVVTSAGNGANKPYVVGSPSIGPGVISVAQTQVPSAKAYPLVVNAPQAIAGIYANTATVEWAPVGDGVTGDVVHVGTACPGQALAASPAGKIALIDRGVCSVSLKVDLAVKAGAKGVLIGLVAPGDAVSFSFGGGDSFAPTLVIQQSLSNAIKAQLTAGTTVNASFSPASAIPLAGSMASTSSRGPSISHQSIKPEIGAPGASVSAQVGTGDGQSAFGGTSGASPMVAGAAALLVQAHPDRSPLILKAMLMNSAETAVYTNPALLPGSLAPITRIGAGELRVQRALGLGAVAWDRKAESAALSFGAVEAAAPMVLERTLRVDNLGAQEKLFQVAASFRDAGDQASGAVQVDVKSSLRVGAHGRGELKVSLKIDPTKLPDWALNGGAQGGNGEALNGPEYDGHITLTAGSEKLSVPWHVLPRKAAALNGTPGSDRDGALVKLRNNGVNMGEYELFSLLGTSTRIPTSQLPEPGDNFAVIDLRAVGVRHLPAEVFGADYLEFAITTHGRRATPNYPAEFDVFIDTNGDGQPDWAVFNAEAGGFSASGQALVYVQNLATGAGGAYFYADADFNSGNMIMTVPMSALNLKPGTTIGLHVEVFENYFVGQVTDTIGGMRFTPGSPRYSVDGEPWGRVDPRGAATRKLRSATVPDSASSEAGVLTMYRRNAGSEADVLKLR